MPAMVKAMADTKGLRPDVHMPAAPAASFQSHWNDGRAREKLEGTAWDFVIPVSYTHLRTNTRRPCRSFTGTPRKPSP